jgi:hypothetical protein
MLKGRCSNVAMHDALAFATTTPLAQLPSPLQPMNAEPRAGAARSVTRVGAEKLAKQSATQSMDPGLPVTRPFPLPLRLTFNKCPWGINVALHDLLLLIVTTPSEQSVSPLQPEKTEPGLEVAMRVTEAPLVKFAEQLALQLIPAGLLVTIPLPVPAAVAIAMILTVSFGVWTALTVKVAVQLLFASMVTTPLLQPVPVQPAKVEPEAGVAVSVTSVPLLNDAEQVLPQLIPAGLLVTVPFPMPLLVVVFTTVTVNVDCCAGGGGVVPAGVVPQISGE